MQRVGAASAVVGMTGLAGCTGLVFEEDDDPEEPLANGNNNNGVNGEEPEYQLIELIPPPTDLVYDDWWPERQVVMTTHDASTAFFDPTQAGLADAAEMLGWESSFTGPTHGFDVEEQVSILESVVDARPDAIITTIADDRAYDSVIAEAFDNDIFVITYNTIAHTPDQERDLFGRSLSYTGQEQVGAGYVCGLALLDRLPDDAELVTIGTCCPGHAALEERTEGIELAIQLNSDLDMTERIDYTGDPGDGVSRLQDHIEANPEVDGIVGTDAFTWFIGEAIDQAGAQDDIVGGGFDLEDVTLEHIADGTLKFTIGQDPYSQGFLPTMLAWEYLERGIPPKDYDTAAEVVDEDNVDFAMERDDWTTLREWQAQTY